MDSIAFLLALLAVAYIGSTLAGAQGRRPQSLISGVEYVLLGAIIGPHVLGMVNHAAVASFEPLAAVAVGWVAMADGFNCAYVGANRVSALRFLQGWLFTAIVACGVASVVAVTASTFGWLAGPSLWIASCGMGLVSSESTRHAVRWVGERRLAQGSLSHLVADFSSADSAFTLPALAFLFLLGGQQKSRLAAIVPSWGFAALTLLLGVALGACVVILFTMPLRKAEAWGVLLATALLGVGLSAGVGAAWPSSLFATGVTISFLVSQRDLLRRRFVRTDRAVVLPALVLAGAYLQVPSSPWFFLLLLAAFVAHAALAMVLSLIITLFSPAARAGGPLLGLAMLSSGPLSMTVGFACALQFDGVAGQLILATAISDTLLGELIGPFTLRRVLRRAGELQDPVSPSAELQAIEEPVRS